MSNHDRPTSPGNPLVGAEEIFVVAAELPAEERAAYLDEACSDPRQRKQVDELFERAVEADRFFEQTADMEAGRPMAAPEAPGMSIGPYTLLRSLGEGGFGCVFLAEQRAPISRRVALKVIKQGMDTHNIIARFEAERQALAMMDHPNIARVLDAGTTASGRSYFVMELVKGVSIGRFSDNHQYDTRQRIELFLDVCSAVNHAHQKGIIHRDLKPNNIIVELKDDQPVPKVIDFGIAKTTQQKLTDKTLSTRFDQMMGTPLYMSPEQADQSVLDVDTRTDIYALGVILYELIAGAPPFEPSELMQTGYDEMRRIIREVDPPMPSSRVANLGDKEREALATHHRTEAGRLARLLRGDLDWILMKCIEKDRTRRYETANALAMDLRRFLDGEFVSARPPSRAYRIRKTFHRNKLAFTAIAAVAGALLLSGTSSAWWAVRAHEARRQAEEAAIRAKELRVKAESRTHMTRAQSLLAQGEFADAQESIFRLHDDYIRQHDEAVAPIFRALGHWNGGAQRWRKCAECYDMFLLGPASGVADRADLKTGWVTGTYDLTRSLGNFPLDLAYLEYGPVLVELGESERYEELCDAGVARYRHIEQEVSDTTIVDDCAERMLHGCLLMPVQPRHRVTFCKWALLVERSETFRFHHATALALFEYRRGHYREALKQAERSGTLPTGIPTDSFKLRADVLAAMAHARLNEREAARKEIDLARAALETRFEGELGVGTYSALWADWLIDRVLLREAEDLMRNPSKTDTAKAVIVDPSEPGWDEAMAQARRELRVIDRNNPEE